MSKCDKDPKCKWLAVGYDGGYYMVDMSTHKTCHIDESAKTDKLLADLAAAHKEIERLNGRRCDGCKWFREYSPRGFCEHVDMRQKHPTDDYTLRHYEPSFSPSHHCRYWEKR